METLFDMAAILALVVAAFLLVFGLFYMPWQVLLLFLVIGLITIWWLIKQNHLEGFFPQSTSPEVSDSTDAVAGPVQSPVLQDHSLSYRGATYQTGSIAASEQPINQIQVSGKYRGSVWRKEPGTSEINQAQKPEITGKYRGCTWKSTSSEN